MKKIFIDGGSGTVGLQLAERLQKRTDIELLKLDTALARDKKARAEMINKADIVFLCLPDDAARESVAMCENEDTVIIDASTAHRTLPEWAYGFPELGREFALKLLSSKRIAVPGCHASGFIALVYPLVKAGIISKDEKLCCFSLTGYSGGGKNMIAEYEVSHRSNLLKAPRQYGLTQQHKHLKEMKYICGLDNNPVFMPVVSDFYSGMEVTVPLFSSQIAPACREDIVEVYKNTYQNGLISFCENSSESGFMSAGLLSGKDNMQITVEGNEERILLIARYDNLGKGASGAAVECMNIAMALPAQTGLNL